MDYSKKTVSIKMNHFFWVFILSGTVPGSCSKKSSTTPPLPPVLNATLVTVNGNTIAPVNNNITVSPLVKFSFSAPLDHNSVSNSFSFANKSTRAEGLQRINTMVSILKNNCTRCHGSIFTLDKRNNRNNNSILCNRCTLEFIYGLPRNRKTNETVRVSKP